MQDLHEFSRDNVNVLIVFLFCFRRSYLIHIRICDFIIFIRRVCILVYACSNQHIMCSTRMIHLLRYKFHVPEEEASRML